MIRMLLKLFAYTQAPKTTFSLLHPVKAVQVAKTPFDFRTAYAPRLTAIATALLVGPLAYRLGKRAGKGAGSLRTASEPGGQARQFDATDSAAPPSA